MKKEHPGTEMLAAFVNGLLTDDESRRIREHASGCPECASKIREFEATVELVRAAAVARAGDGARVVSIEASEQSGSHLEGERLAAYADGSLDAAEAREAEAHLALCAACTREVADLWSMQSEPGVEPGESAVLSAVRRLNGAPLTAVIRLAGRSVELVRGFARDLSDAAAALGEPREPAFAAARGAESCADIVWSGGSAVLLEGRIDTTGGDPALRGRLTVSGRPGVGLSVALMGEGVRRGPESTDRKGYFGPWKLAEGRNTIVLTGSAVGADPSGIALTVVVER